ncbi:27523_t:CDS:2, partial [Dentiscutata erythropus]
MSPINFGVAQKSEMEFEYIEERSRKRSPHLSEMKAHRGYNYVVNMVMNVLLMLSKSHLWSFSRAVVNRIHGSRIESSSHTPGDGGIDWIGGWRGYTIIIQCK